MMMLKIIIMIILIMIIIIIIMMMIDIIIIIVIFIPGKATNKHYLAQRGNSFIRHTFRSFQTPTAPASASAPTPISNPTPNQAPQRYSTWQRLLPSRGGTDRLKGLVWAK